MPSSTHRQRKLAASTAHDQAGSLGAGGGAGVLAGAGGGVRVGGDGEGGDGDDGVLLAGAPVRRSHSFTHGHLTLLLKLSVVPAAASAALAALCRGAAPTQMIFTSRAAITVRPSPGSWG